MDGWLCRIAITTKGKYTALEAEAIEPLVELVSDDDSEVRTYALKVNCCTTTTTRTATTTTTTTIAAAAATTTTTVLDSVACYKCLSILPKHNFGLE